MAHSEDHNLEGVEEAEPGRHHNEPPLEERLPIDYADLASDIEAVAKRANGAPKEIVDDIEQGSVTELANDIRDLIKRATNHKDVESAPFIRGHKIVLGYFKTFTERLERMQAVMLKRTEDYLEAKRLAALRERQEIERKAREKQAEADRLAQKAIQDAQRIERENNERRRAEEQRLADEKRQREQAERDRQAEIARQEAAARTAKQQAAAKIAREKMEQEQAAQRERQRVLDAAAEERRLQDEQDRRRQEQIALDTAAADQEAADRAAQVAMQAARETQAKPADMARTRSSGPKGGIATLVTSWDFEVTDYPKVDLEALRPFLKRDDVEKAIRTFVRINKGSSQIEGVRIFEVRGAQTR